MKHLTASKKRGILQKYTHYSAPPCIHPRGGFFKRGGRDEQL